jgi:Sap-like sulfolipid-1-addressing protein
VHRISELNYSTFGSIIAVIGFNLVMLLLLEGPLLAFAVAPTWTPQAIDRTKAWVGRHVRKVAIYRLEGIGGALALKGIIGSLGAVGELDRRLEPLIVSVMSVSNSPPLRPRQPDCE